MAVVCGEDSTTLVTEKGDLWAFGKGDHGVLGLGTDAHQLLPACVGGADEVFGGEAVVMVAGGFVHQTCVTAKGTLWTWGTGRNGQMGHGDEEPRQRPARLGKEMYGGSPAVMVACGNRHTLVLTSVFEVWSCGCGLYGQLGHCDVANKLVLTLVADQRFRGAQIVMVAADGRHSVALGAEGRVWTWGWGHYGQLGHNDEEKRLVPTLMPGDALGGAAVVLVAAGLNHTVAVTIEGALRVWGCGDAGQLGLGDEDKRLVPTLVGAETAFGGLQVLTVACGNVHTLAVTKDCALWIFGTECGLGHNRCDGNHRLLPSRIEAQYLATPASSLPPPGPCTLQW